MTERPRAPRRVLLRLEPPVNSVVPIGRTRLAALWAAYGDGSP